MSSTFKITIALIFSVLWATSSTQDIPFGVPLDGESAVCTGINSTFTSTPDALSLREILRDFQWMGDKGNGQNAFARKPFLQMNTEGSRAAAGIVDINRDGEKEFILSVMHVPRGIPSVEVFEIQGNRLQSMGGFFESREGTGTLTFYQDPEGRLLFLQETESHYSGITRTLVATYVNDFHNVPIACASSQYGQAGTQRYYLFPSDKQVACTNTFLSGRFDEVEYVVTADEYRLALSRFMNSLKRIEDVNYEYCVYYHLYNGCELTNEVRYNEISQANKTSATELFQTEQEYKKTSDIVADALWKFYMEETT